MNNTMVQKKCLHRVRLSHKVDCCAKLAARQWFADHGKKKWLHMLDAAISEDHHGSGLPSAL